MHDGRLAGTIGIMPCGDDTAVLKKFFVYEKYQDEPHHMGQQLYAYFLEFAKEKGFKTIMPDTPFNTVRAHKFYERAGFEKVTEDELPIKFSHPYKDCGFFMLNLEPVFTRNVCGFSSIILSKTRQKSAGGLAARQGFLTQS